ncbi:AAA family ATPase [Psychrosphaera sp. F3M07]|uniref:McrB family protein n=1 Tax=Psychrosphaera sp. F3M07 TaxID=2841560 RepID=UPI001C088BB1|nr:AAA family ATPase [Psychrosphaera sp. F3M07]MBU2919626.1 AAA family ATPase [Psychrosphaera sp. F3M07]
MIKELDKRINNIKSLEKDQCWYITRQSLDFKDLCYAAKIVNTFKDRSDQNINFESFFKEKAAEYNISTVHRMTRNCLYVGLCQTSGSKFEDYYITSEYKEIEKLCEGKFENVDLYEEIMIKLIEKIFISAEHDEQNDDLRKNIRLHPTLFLYKILASLYDLGLAPEITLNEFRLFVGTAERYQDWFTTIALIIESRKDNSVFELEELNDLYDKFEESSHLPKTVTEGNRFNVLFKNLPFLVVTQSNIKLSTDYIQKIKTKLIKYESLLVNATDLENINLDDLFVKIDQETITSSIKVEEIHANYFNKELAVGDNRIFYGPPGTGKSQLVLKNIQKLNLPPQNIEVVTFHPEFDYQSFIGTYKPVSVFDGNTSNSIQYRFVPQSFIKIYARAWLNPNENFVLQIEEINRGNCAEIFGDIFQLLDRDPNYKISASTELLAYLAVEFKDNPTLLKSLDSGKLMLPNNLFIWATMNTSDQSLFPMDSAFKRRWDWVYVPINYDCTDSNFKIVLKDGSSYSWLEFIREVNKQIVSITLSPDKQIGNWFINANKSEQKGIISQKQFINKILFYLWNDILKEETDSFLTNENGDTILYDDFFDASNAITLIKSMFAKLSVKQIETTP